MQNKPRVLDTLDLVEVSEDKIALLFARHAADGVADAHLNGLCQRRGGHLRVSA